MIEARDFVESASKDRHRAPPHAQIAGLKSLADKCGAVLTPPLGRGFDHRELHLDGTGHDGLVPQAREQGDRIGMIRIRASAHRQSVSRGPNNLQPGLERPTLEHLAEHFAERFFHAGHRGNGVQSDPCVVGVEQPFGVSRGLRLLPPVKRFRGCRADHRTGVVGQPIGHLEHHAPVDAGQ